MYLAAVFIVCACISQALAEQTEAQTAACNAGSVAKDGFSLLKKEVTFRLALTTFTSLNTGRYRCIAATTTLRDEDRHEVTEVVRYQVDLNEWYSFSQSFKFTCGSKGYNTMSSTDNSTVPYASYEFLTTDPKCIILQYLRTASDHEGQDRQEMAIENEAPQDENNEASQPQARSETQDDAKKSGEKEDAQPHNGVTRPSLDCMLWVEGPNTEISSECERKFLETCGGILRRTFTTKGCVLANPDAQIVKLN
uniref:Putative lipocalin-6 1 n=1 Tax=Amblyomma triste TaxID=251400 RepID=A0A023GB75_AMBTT